MTIKQFAAAAGISYWVAGRYIREGKIEATFTSRGYDVPQSTLDWWLANEKESEFMERDRQASYFGKVFLVLYRNYGGYYPLGAQTTLSGARGFAKKLSGGKSKAPHLRPTVILEMPANSESPPNFGFLITPGDRHKNYVLHSIEPKGKQE